MVPFGVPILMWHLLFRVPKRDLNFDNYPFLTIFGIHSKFLNKNPVQGFQWAVRILSKAQGGAPRISSAVSRRKGMVII